MVFDVHKDTPAQSVSASRHAVDLGLSVKWADMNVGAESAEQSGYYFSWGETAEKILYTESSYDHYAGGNYADLGTQISGTEHDAATALWGDKWRMPTNKEFQELVEGCTWYWITQNGVSGYKVFGPNGNSIFLPAAGGRYGSSLYDAGSQGYYWSSSYNEYSTDIARYLHFSSGYHRTSYDYRYCGQSVRAVCP